jgi:hypothetical protein
MGGSAEARPSVLGGLAVVVRLQIESEPGPESESDELAEPDGPVEADGMPRSAETAAEPEPEPFSEPTVEPVERAEPAESR